VLCSLNRRALEAYEERVDELFGLRGADTTTNTEVAHSLEAARHGV
jgi:hypothetical protein